MLLAFLALTISGCASKGDFAANPSPAQLATPARTRTVTAVAVTDRCSALARQVADPGWKVGDDARVVIKRYEAALELQNTRLGATGACIRRMVREYAAGLRWRR
jgi:hypothetical protein